MPSYTKYQLEAFDAMQRHFKRPLRAITVQDLKPDPTLANLVTIKGGLKSKRAFHYEDHLRRLYQAWLIRRVAR
jgi:hypothetical protein